ncbi:MULTISPECIES: arsenite efflux transporter metallochaperone ArsD [Aerococcus]|uniref:Arsenite efflux transporter metallochaperone ArsD n=1 Tax=Aerococcus sanguinicola TaxID=119206 RepID=A0A5N1GJK5_9LACT|nr:MULTISPECIES: arsenite efflux transporter metallochaperone ArsD [Aerococcus]KAA9300526.1 arsenite efflux transporter metallochaperone ArsD [Aerococcus sanguinicola]MDK6370170.1 arsenite efflux transporter metallochaperone ArsD [Aerococcus sp. UMB9870]MDK6680294.1 arsenite efflux transporter metallochaperone ArsD [Aerococcus sp. UMB8608]MDK6686874.1 arsenite efflux transporter metallochaperone ArsD [Aerococcus sp. UMB8623]MDK6939985.1 arsenite efflux transporter metallochaperone ArsD [Aeroco
MKRIELYEPAMCCQTGICGPSVDPQLLEVSGIYERINNSDTCEAVRYNLAQNPQAFVDNGTAIQLIHKNGKKILPITLVDGEIVKTGDYPSREEFREYTGIEL